MVTIFEHLAWKKQLIMTVLKQTSWFLSFFCKKFWDSPFLQLHSCFKLRAHTKKVTWMTLCKWARVSVMYLGSKSYICTFRLISLPNPFFGSIEILNTNQTYSKRYLFSNSPHSRSDAHITYTNCITSNLQLHSISKTGQFKVIAS